MITKKLRKIKFPVYVLPYDVYTEGSILYIDTPTGTKIVDNKRLDGEDLALRRTRIDKRDKFYLRVCLETPEELVRTTGVKAFIDSSGMVYYFRREKYYPLKSFKIKKKVHLPGLGWAIEVLGIPTRFFLSNMSPEGFNYATVLCIDGGFIIYGLTRTKQRVTRRKI